MNEHLSLKFWLLYLMVLKEENPNLLNDAWTKVRGHSPSSVFAFSIDRSYSRDQHPIDPAEMVQISGTDLLPTPVEERLINVLLKTLRSTFSYNMVCSKEIWRNLRKLFLNSNEIREFEDSINQGLHCAACNTKLNFGEVVTFHSGLIIYCSRCVMPEFQACRNSDCDGKAPTRKIVLKPCQRCQTASSQNHP